ncbi:MAG: hypothetical protein OSJ59_06000 [Lachnospiraceae bacterium]|nr:hypothetical protein [Lachnospiraceae bacterium]
MPLVNPGAQPDTPSFGHRNPRSTRKKIPDFLQDILLFLLLFAASYAVLLFFIKPVDAINDDWGMYSILSGAYTGTPDAHVMFFLYPLSWLLSKLYTVWRFIPWYGLFQHTVQALCLFMVYRRILRIYRRRNPQASPLLPALAAFLLLFFIIDLNVLAEAQYTTTAGLAAAAALFCFITSRINQSTAGFFLDNIPTLLFAWVSFSMRQNIFYLMIPMAGMLWLSKWISAYKNEYEGAAAKLLGFALFLVLGLGLLWGVNAAAYSAEEWSDFRKINHYRERVGDFYGWPEYEECPEDLAALGLDEEAYMYRRSGAPHIGYDMSVADWKQMHDLARRCYLARVSLSERLKPVAVSAVNVFFYQDGMQPANLLAGLLLLLTPVLIFFERNARALFVYLMYLFGRSVSWGYVLYEGRFPKRIVQPLITVDFLILLGILLAFNLLPYESRRLYYVLLALLFVLSAFSVYATRQDVTENYRVHEKTWTDLREYCAAHPYNFYIWTYGSGTLEHFYETPFGRGQDAYQNFIYTNWGVICNPNTQKKLDAHGIGNFGRDLVDSEHVYFILQDAPYNEEHPVVMYFRHTYQAGLTVTDTFTAGDTTYMVYQLYPL